MVGRVKKGLFVIFYNLLFISLKTKVRSLGLYEGILVWQRKAKIRVDLKCEYIQNFLTEIYSLNHPDFISVGRKV